MSSISSLLNPAPEKSGDSHYREPIYDSPELSTLSATDDGDTGPSDTVDVPPSWTKKAEDPLPIGAPRGRLNFPPFEGQSDEIRRQVAAFHIQNYGNIRQQCKHIPYNSGKKDFQFKTGRDCLDVIQYRFRIKSPEGQLDDHVVMWDYIIGLVRMTPFFKACGWSKTTPARVLNTNKGLSDLTTSITGGSITAQGYWMHFDCAKAVLATFCAPIAGALIPIFGPDFPALCLPKNHKNFGKFIIDPAIVAASAAKAEELRREYGDPALYRVPPPPLPLPPSHLPAGASSYDNSDDSAVSPTTITTVTGNRTRVSAGTAVPLRAQGGRQPVPAICSSRDVLSLNTSGDSRAHDQQQRGERYLPSANVLRSIGSSGRFGDPGYELPLPYAGGSVVSYVSDEVGRQSGSGRGEHKGWGGYSSGHRQGYSLSVEHGHGVDDFRRRQQRNRYAASINAVGGRSGNYGVSDSASTTGAEPRRGSPYMYHGDRDGDDENDALPSSKLPVWSPTTRHPLPNGRLLPSSSSSSSSSLSGNSLGVGVGAETGTLRRNRQPSPPLVAPAGLLQQSRRCAINNVNDSQPLSVSLQQSHPQQGTGIFGPQELHIRQHQAVGVDAANKSPSWLAAGEPNPLLSAVPQRVVVVPSSVGELRSVGETAGSARCDNADVPGDGDGQASAFQETAHPWQQPQNEDDENRVTDRMVGLAMCSPAGSQPYRDLQRGSSRQHAAQPSMTETVVPAVGRLTVSGTSSYDYNVRTGETSEHDGIEMSGSSQDGGGPIPPSISIPQPPILGPPLPQLPSPHVVGDPGPVVTLTHATAAAAENSAALALLGLGKTTTAAGPQMNKEEVCDTESGDAPPRTALSPAPRSSPRAADHVIRAPATAVAKVGDKHDRKSPDGGDRDNDSSRSSSRFSSDEDEAYQPVSSRLVRKRGRWEDEPRPTTRATRRVWTQTEPGSSDSAMGSGTVAGGEGGACQGRQVKRVRAGV